MVVITKPALDKQMFKEQAGHTNYNFQLGATRHHFDGTDELGGHSWSIFILEHVDGIRELLVVGRIPGGLGAGGDGKAGGKFGNLLNGHFL